MTGTVENALDSRITHIKRSRQGNKKSRILLDHKVVGCMEGRLIIIFVIHIAHPPNSYKVEGTCTLYHSRAAINILISDYVLTLTLFPQLVCSHIISKYFVHTDSHRSILLSYSSLVNRQENYITSYLIKKKNSIPL